MATMFDSMTKVLVSNFLVINVSKNAYKCVCVCVCVCEKPIQVLIIKKYAIFYVWSI